MSNSVDPDETAHCLIWIYVVCKSLLLSPMAVKELNEVINGKAYQIYEELHILEKKRNITGSGLVATIIQLYKTQTYISQLTFRDI